MVHLGAHLYVHVLTSPTVSKTFGQRSFDGFRRSFDVKKHIRYLAAIAKKMVRTDINQPKTHSYLSVLDARGCTLSSFNIAKFLLSRFCAEPFWLWFVVTVV